MSYLEYERKNNNWYIIGAYSKSQARGDSWQKYSLQKSKVRKWLMAMEAN